MKIDLKLRNIATRDKGVHIASDGGKEISVVALSEERTSGDLFLVLPPVYLPDKYEYYAISVPKLVTTIEDEDEVEEPIHMSAFLIVASEDDTLVSLSLTQSVNTSSAPDITGKGSTGDPLVVTLKEMDTLYIANLDDLSGSRVVANKPITFISGHECGNLPADMQYCDHMFEQIPPTSTWGRVFYTAPLSSRTQFDHYKFVSSEDNTKIDGVCGPPVKRVNLPEMMNAGDIRSFDVSSKEFCQFTSNKPVLLMQFSVAAKVDNTAADPFMVMIAPVEQYRNEYLVTTFETRSRSDEQYYVNVVMESQFDRSSLLLNDAIVTEEWTEIMCENSTELLCAYGVQLPLNISKRAQVLSHENRFSVTVYSFGLRVGQGYVAGINQRPLACKNSICVLSTIRQGSKYMYIQ